MKHKGKKVLHTHRWPFVVKNEEEVGSLIDGK